jgi:hypothetical protein
MKERQYADPYLAGIGLGLVLLAAFVFADRGLGASGAFTRAAAWARGATAASAVEERGSTAEATVAPQDGVPQDSDPWLLFEIAGVFVGGFVSALLAGRLRREVERGPRISRGARLGFAFAGGATMGLGAVLARGCTSGLALTGGALLSVGGWIFVGAAFAAAYLAAPLLRKAWR